MLNGGEARNEVMLYGIAILHFGFIVAARDNSSRGGLFISHPDRTMKHRPAFTVAGIEGIVVLSSKVIESKAVKPRSIVSAEAAKPIELRSGQVRVVR